MLQLAPGAEGELSKRLLEISDPNSPRYGHWLAQREAHELIEPTQGNRKQAAALMKSAGVACEYEAYMLRCSGTAAAVERLLGVPVSVFRRMQGDAEDMAEQAILYRVHPDDMKQSIARRALAGKIAFFSGLHDLPRASAPGAVQRSLSGGPMLTVTSAPALSAIETLWNVYNFHGGFSGDAATPQATVELQSASAARTADISSFAAANGIPVREASAHVASVALWALTNQARLNALEQKQMEGAHFVLHSVKTSCVLPPSPMRYYIYYVQAWSFTQVVGPLLNGGPIAAQSVDVQTLGAVGRGNSHWNWTEADWVLGLGQRLAATPDEWLPAVVTISQHVAESMQCAVDPVSQPCVDLPADPASNAAYIEAVNTLLAAATARGVTILASAGDAGAHAGSDTECAQPLMPTFPATSPWVTAVGSTRLANAQHIDTPRTNVCKLATQASGTAPRCARTGNEFVLSSEDGAAVTSGGGFSWTVARPNWQEAAVSAYLNSGVQLPDAAAFNPDGRAIPDVSALGAQFPVWANGMQLAIDSTGAATAVWGGVVALANAARARQGLPRLGYINPLLYQLAADPSKGVFHDVTVGNNACNRAPCAAACTPDKGFQSTDGWDPASGLGTPNVLAFMQAVVPGYTTPQEPPIVSAGVNAKLATAAAVVAAALCAVVAMAVL